MSNFTHAYNIGDKVKLEGYSDWLVIDEIRVSRHINADSEMWLTAYAGLVEKSFGNDLVMFYEDDVIDIKREVQPVTKNRKQRIDELLDHINTLKMLNEHTNGAFLKELQKAQQDLQVLAKEGA